MTTALGLSVGERLTLSECVEHSRICEAKGFESIWVAEGRLTRDAIVPMTLIANSTTTIKLATGVTNHKTRNAALMAVTFRTLSELAPGRVILGIGPWWEPLASRVGAPLVHPVAELREYLAAVRALLRSEMVDFDGDYVQMDQVRLDRMYQDNAPVDIPVYIGAVGPKMLEFAGEVADGVLLDFHVPVTYVKDATKRIQNGIARRCDGVTTLDLPQLVTCSVDDADPQSAIDECKAFLTMYLAQQPHITKYSGVDDDLIGRIKSEMGWPATPSQVRRVMRLVSNELVQNLTACGTTDMAIEQIESYVEAGATCAVLCTLGNKEETLRNLAEAAK